MVENNNIYSYLTDSGGQEFESSLAGCLCSGSFRKLHLRRQPGLLSSEGLTGLEDLPSRWLMPIVVVRRPQLLTALISP